MRNSKFIFFAAVAISAIAGICAASAADLAARPYTKAPPMVAAPVLSWTGCYVGGNVGYGWSNENWYDPKLSFDTSSHTSTGAVAGGQLGCDLQAGNFVFGVQGMVDWANLSGSGQDRGDARFVDHSKISAFATVTGRIGYTVQPATLIYLKGGGAWVWDSFTETAPFAIYPGNAKATRDGWTIGGGVEHRFTPNWSVFVEYNYMDFGRRTSTLHYADNVTLYNFNIKLDVQNVLFGVNYRFGGGY